MENRGRDWRTILLVTASLGSAALALTLAVSLVFYALLGLARSNFIVGTASTTLQGSMTPLQAVVLASGLMFTCVAFLPAAYYSVQRLRGRDGAAYALKPLRIWEVFLLLLLWVSACMLAQLLVDKGFWRWFTPLLYLLAIGTPVYFLVRLSTGGLNAGSHQRFWGVIFTSMAVSTVVAMLAEAVLIIIALLGVGVYLALHPDQMTILQQMADQLTSTSGVEQSLNALGPWLNHPPIFILALLFFSGLTPVIEETAKSISIWATFDHVESPVQGFALGALSGAGFGLVESLLASAVPDASWASTLLIRGGSTMMHIMATGLTGWGIALFRTGTSARQRAGGLFGMYMLAVFLHSLWNASVVALAFGGLRIALNAGTQDIAGLGLVATGAFILIVLCLAIPIALATINRRLRTSGSARLAVPFPAGEAGGRRGREI